MIEYKTAEPTATVYSVMEKDKGFYWGQAPLLTLDTWVHSVFVLDGGYVLLPSSSPDEPLFRSEH